MYIISFLGSLCMNGIRNEGGIYGLICCAQTCGQCGGEDCDKSTGGDTQCCEGVIHKSGKICETSADTACIMLGN